MDNLCRPLLVGNSEKCGAAIAANRNEVAVADELAECPARGSFA